MKMVWGINGEFFCVYKKMNFDEVRVICESDTNNFWIWFKCFMRRLKKNWEVLG